MDLKNKLLKDIHDLSDKSEQPYAGVSEDLDSVKGVSSDIGTASLGVVKEILDGASEDSLDGLKLRIKRIEELKKNLEKAQLGPEETSILSSCISRVSFALNSHIQQKRKVLNAASGAISKITPHLGSAMLGMTYNNPVMQLAVMAGGKLSQIVKDKMQKKKEGRDILKGDAKKMYSSTLSQADQPVGPTDLPSEDEPVKPESDFPASGSGSYGSGLENFNSDGSSLVMESSAGYGKVATEIASDVHFIAEELLLVIDGLKPLEEISNNIGKLVRVSEEAEDEKDQLELDSLESAMEGPSLPSGAGGKEKPAKGGLLGKAKGLIPDMKSLSGVAKSALSGMASVLFTSTTAMVAGLVWALVDGVSGWLKAEDWGVSKISGFLGGMMGGTFSNKIVNVFANMGKWALIGATIGAPVFGIGAIAGGIIGALVGGLLGWIGGENIAGFFDDFGTWISDSWSTGFDMIKNFFLDVWDFAQDMIDSVNNVIDSIKLAIVGWVKGTIDWLVSKDPTGWAEGKFKPLTDGLGKMQEGLEADIESRAERREKRAQDQQARHATSAAERQARNDQYYANQEARAIKQAKGDESSSASGGAGGSGGSATPAESGMAQGGGEFVSSATGKPVPSTGFDGTPSMNVPAPSGQSLSKDETKSAVLAELQAKGITDPNAQANILANLQAESNFKAQSENLNYSAKTLMKLYGPGSGNKVRVRNLQEAQAIVDKGPEAIGNLIYGGRMGNAGDEGYKYRGRGLVQLTGKDNYTAMSKKLGIDLVSNPDLANDPQIAAKISAQYYADRKSKFNYNDISQVAKATGHAGGQQETLRRAGYAQNLKAEIASGKIGPSGVVHPDTIKPDLQGASVVPASYNTVNQQSPQMSQAGTTVVNNVNNVSSVSNSGGSPQSRPNDTGTSSMKPVVRQAYL